MFCALLAAATLAVASPAESPPPAIASATTSTELGINGSTMASTTRLAIAPTVRGKREDFIRGWCNNAYGRGNRKYNVIVLKKGYWRNVKGIVYRNRLTWTDWRGRKSRFSVFTFRSGTFVNTGDGGYANWCMIGRFRRSGFGGKVVTFW